MRRFLLACCTVATLFGATAAHAALVIDQQNLVHTNPTNGSTSAGQSFTAGLNGIDFAIFKLGAQSLSTTVKVNIYAGSGYGGTLLGSTASQTVTSQDQMDYQFTFANRIGLTEGSVYTLQILASTGSYGMSIVNANAYAGGSWFSSGGTSTGNSTDAYFREGINTDGAVPEPATWATMILGMGAVGYAMRRRRSVRVAYAA